MKLSKNLQISTEFPPWLFLRLGGGRKCGSGGDREPEATASALARSAVSRIQLAGPWDMAARNRAQSASGETPLLETGGCAEAIHRFARRRNAVCPETSNA